MPTIHDLQCGEVYTTGPYHSAMHDTSDSMGVTVGYLSAIAPRQIMITRPVKHLGMKNRHQTSTMNRSRSISSGPVPLRGTSTDVRRSLMPFTSQRNEEKRQLAELNDQFADYACKVRYLEAVNHKRMRDLNRIRNKRGIGLRRALEIMAREKHEAEQTMKRMDDELRAGQEKRQQAEQCLQHVEQRMVRIQRSDPVTTIKNRLRQSREEIVDLETRIDSKRKTILDNDEALTWFIVELQHMRTDTDHLTSEIAKESIQKQLLLAERTILEQELTAFRNAH